MNSWFLISLSSFLHIDRYSFLFISTFLVLPAEISIYTLFLSSVSCHSSSNEQTVSRSWFLNTTLY